MAASDPETKLKRDYNADSDLPQQTCSVNKSLYVTRIHLKAGYHVVDLYVPERNPTSLENALEQSGWDDEPSVANLRVYDIGRTAWDAQ